MKRCAFVARRVSTPSRMRIAAYGRGGLKPPRLMNSGLARVFIRRGEGRIQSGSRCRSPPLRESQALIDPRPAFFDAYFNAASAAS
jgi:hypothetical protein